MKEQNFTPKAEQPTQEKERQFYDELFEQVKKIYETRLSRLENPKDAQRLLSENINHVKQVGDNVDFLIAEMESGEIRDAFISRDADGRAIFDKRALRALTILHDVAKVDEQGMTDTFYHHEKDKLRKLIIDKDSPINHLLRDNGFDDEQIEWMLNGIEGHSRRTDFIYKHFFNKNVKQPEKEGQLSSMKPLDEQVDYTLPSPEGMLEYTILSDADILSQSKLDQGVKKIVCNRLFIDKFKKEDAAKDGQHSFAKAWASAFDSAERSSAAMHFDVMKQRAHAQFEQVEKFGQWLESNNKIQEIDKVDDFGKKKEIFDQLIEEFLKIDQNK